MNKENKIDIDELIKYYKDTLPPLIDYAEMVGAPQGYYGIQYVYDDPYGYYAEATIAALEELKRLRKDMYLLIGNWFCALEDEGCNPWTNDYCMEMASKHGYTKDDYKEFLKTIC